jgi:hypothetical protein
MCLSGLVVKALVCFYEVWVQSLMDACLNVSCTNAIKKHIHHGEDINMYIMLE